MILHNCGSTGVAEFCSRVYSAVCGFVDLEELQGAGFAAAEHRRALCASGYFGLELEWRI